MVLVWDGFWLTWHCLVIQATVDKTFVNRVRWTQMSIMSTAGSGKFSSDHTIEEYAKGVWGIKPVKRIWRLSPSLSLPVVGTFL